ncbi:hypothetical protein Tco_0212201 [Tanacetum coccineum]
MLYAKFSKVIVDSEGLLVTIEGYEGFSIVCKVNGTETYSCKESSIDWGEKVKRTLSVNKAETCAVPQFWPVPEGSEDFLVYSDGHTRA